MFIGFLTPLVVIPVRAAGAEAPACTTTLENSVITSPYLSVLTLNMAHGRKSAFNQMLQRTATTRRNLEEIADFLSNSKADLVALQEADAPSRWSGKFNHVEFVAQRSPYPCRIHARHARKYMYDFGTALLSQVPFVNSIQHTFAPSPPTTNKGFVMGEVLWNPNGELAKPVSIGIVSVHLDFSRRKVREAQAEEMRAMLAGITPPMIILGDFNTDWTADESALKTIVEKGGFRVYQPESQQLGTYKKGKRRLDWILISRGLEFVTYTVAQTILSDHQAVQASVRLVEAGDKD